MSPSVFITGLLTGLSLIVAIGAQNAFVLRQGLRGEHVLAVCLTCSLSDAVLIAAGVSGFGRVLHWAPWLAPVMRYAGAAFLIGYGVRSMHSALRASRVLEAGGGQSGLPSALLTCLALTWLNPHVYLDTLVLLGAVSTHFAGQAVAFALGAASASFLFFFGLGYGATWLRPVFARPATWRALDAAIAVLMWGIAAKLMMGG